MITSPNQIEDNALARALSQRLTINRDLALYCLIFLLAVFSRFHMLGERVMSHDESLHTRYSYNLYNEGDFTHTPLMHGPVLFHATALSFYLFGDNDFTGRIYTAALGVLMVMFPLLWRRWLGRWGALLASVMILVSPLLLYYHRYIRHDTPSIFFGMVMAHCILQYLDGAQHQRGRGRWLYIFAAAMILNLGSKETAFIYLGIFGSFLAIFFLARLAQARYEIGGKPLFQQVMLGILLGGMMTLGMYIIVDIVPAQIIPGRGTPWSDLSDLQRSTFSSWMALAILSGAFVLITTALYAFRDLWQRIPRREIGVIFLIALITAGSLLFIEELSHWPDTTGGDSDSGESLSNAINWLPSLALWALAAVVCGYLLRDRRMTLEAESRDEFDEAVPHISLWQRLREYPEIDFLVLIVTLILPWTTALFTRMAGGDSSAFQALAESLPQGIANLLAAFPGVGGGSGTGQFLVGASAFLPLALIAVVIGLTWNWRRWLICALIFHAIFAVVYTSVFTNIAGLGTGMIYSLGYWLEQQGVRRGSQPQFYYLLIILPTYEFLPIIGSVTAMFAGVTCFWKSRRKAIIEAEERALLEADAALNDDSNPADTGDEPAAASAEKVKVAPARTPLLAPLREDTRLKRLPFVLLLAWWAILNLVGYSLAGEKMPWLGTHMTLPMILITAWYFGGVFARIDQRKLLRQGWIALLALPVFLITAGTAAVSVIAGDQPFSGLTLEQLQDSYQWLGALLVAAGSGAVIARLAPEVGWMHLRRLCAAAIFGLLCLLTARAAWMASFINYDLPTELLVYAHSAPSVKWTLNDIHELSLRKTDGLEMKFAYDDEVSWPYSWYFRNFTSASFVGANPTMQNTEEAAVVVVGAGNRGDVEPVLEDRYYRRDHMRMWWPMQEYFGVTPERLLNVLDFTPGNGNAAQLRRGIFDIWWARDYERYGDATGKDFSLTNWPVSDKMHVYVRKDIAAEIWSYGLGEGEAPVETVDEVNQCAANWQQVFSLGEFDTSATAMNFPLGMAVANDLVFVADENDNLVHVLEADSGAFVRSYGLDDGLSFNRPNSVAILPNGDLLVVDTWNYRIQRIDPRGNPVYSWGEAGEFGFDAQTDPVNGFWGPRDVVVDGTGRAFVSDTGNKRIRVYSLEEGGAAYQFDIGSGGSAKGELDEPAGLAVSSDGRLYIADTWNRRISVFLTSGIHHTDFRVRGWYNTTWNRPYLAMDEGRDLLYITDPDSRRILVHNLAGECIGSFGEEGGSASSAQFTDIGGIAVDTDGFVYISDSAEGIVSKYPPFVRG